MTSPELDEEVITTPTNAVRVLGGVEIEMARRYDVLAAAGVRNIEEFNELAEKGQAVSPEGETLNPISFLVVVIDELADLMMIMAKDVEEPIARLAQMARAVGIHLIVATQRPSVDVITGVIKANFPARLAFQVASKTDSRTILDANGNPFWGMETPFLFRRAGDSPSAFIAAMSAPARLKIWSHILKINLATSTATPCGYRSRKALLEAVMRCWEIETSFLRKPLAWSSGRDKRQFPYCRGG